tara:strand:- start:495 stop:1520 length:1026 start_codon:yes stop_codon:yes gene_type:complete
MLSNKPSLVAEISANHNGSLITAKKLIKISKKYGADAVKLQTYDENSMTLNSKKKEFLINKGLWKGYSLWNLYKKAKTPYSWHRELFSYAKKIGITCFSSAFDENAVDLLESLNCPIYKVASFEITDITLLERIAKTKKPVILSTGLSNINEIDLAYKTLKKNGTKDITILYCVSNYPSKLDDFNLKNIPFLKKKYKCKIGLSDHSLDNKVAITAVSLGAEIIEKHIGLENQKKGLDLDFSLRGKEILRFRKDITETYRLLGRNSFVRKKSELKNLRFRRSLFVVKDIKKGEKFTKFNIRSLRPNIGLSPVNIKRFIGKKSKIDIKSNTSITKKLIRKILV